MTWQITLSLVIIIHSFALLLNKILANKIAKKSVGMFYQYLFLAGVLALYAIFSKRVDINFVTVLVAGIGFLNSFGYYYQWRAFELNLSKTVLFFPLAQVLAIGLAIAFLKEFALLNTQLFLGVISTFVAIWFFQSSRIKSDAEENVINRKWLFFMLMIIVVAGLGDFLIKLFSFTVSRGNFLVAWYFGCFLGSLLILGLEKQSLKQLSLKTILLSWLLGLAFLGATFFLYWTYQLGGPLSLVLPLQHLGVTMISILIGWFIFKEQKRLSKKEWFGFLLGIIGAILILFR